MAEGRYDITLDDVPAEIVGIRQVGVPMGLINRHTEPGYLLADIRAAYKGRSEQVIQERQQAAEKSAKKKRRSFER